VSCEDHFSITFSGNNLFNVGASFAGEVELAIVTLTCFFLILVAFEVRESPQESWKVVHLSVVVQDTGGLG
jgi:hypothetical protein